MTSKNGKPDFLELVKSDRRAPPKPPKLLASVQQQLLEACERLLEQLFSASDDVLYDLSKRAGSNSDENLYFESMRELRIARQSIARGFLQNLQMSFNALLENRRSPDAVGAQPFNAQDLALMAGDELEIDLALKGMVSRARQTYNEELYELTMRLDHLLLQVDIDSDNNPLDPEAIAHAFVDACIDTFEVDIKAKLILLKLFEKHLLKQLQPVYAAANQLLLDAGVLPKVPRQPQQNAAPAPVPEGTAGPVADQELKAEQQPGQPVFQVGLDALVSLVAGVRQATRSSQTPVVNCFVFATANPGPVMGANTLASMLTRAQLLAERQLAKGPRNLVPDLVQAILAKANAEMPQALSESDEAIINLVSMFFNEVLADENLPLAVDALICRLQIPILKLALKDRSLFHDPNHPARRLVNTMTRAGIGFEDGKQLEIDPVYRKMVDLVQTVAREPRADASLYEQLDMELQSVLEAEQRKSGLVEKRTSQAANGRARIRTARNNAQNLLYSKLKDVQLPGEIIDFLTTAWMQVLIITQLKHGCDSAEWQACGHTASDLIWFCQPHMDVRSLQRRERLQPALMAQLEAGLEAAIESPEVRADKLGELHQALDAINHNPEATLYQRLTPEQAAGLGRGANDDSTMAAQPREEIPAEHLQAAEQLCEGQWVEFRDGESGRIQRYKLATRVDPDCYVFVNRKGFKVFECTSGEVARHIQAGRLKVLSTDVFFDRLMNRVVSHLEQAA